MLRATSSRRDFARAARTVRPSLEQLESRFVPYGLNGGSWLHSELITVSFVPDGTWLGMYNSQGQPIVSTLFADMNARFGSPAVWQREILKGANAWARQANLNFMLVEDNGAKLGHLDYLQQGDPNFGDIRIGGAKFTTLTGWNILAAAYAPQPINNYSIAGDMYFNTDQPFSVSSTGYNLFTVAAHEFGHSLGLSHTTVSNAVMYATYPGVKSDIQADDALGIRALYDGARVHDVFDIGTNNNSFSAATNVTLDPTTKAVMYPELDITTATDTDYFKVVIPAGSSGTLRVKFQSEGLSLLAPKVYIYNSAYMPKALANGAGQYGTTLTATLSGVTAGQVYYVKVMGADMYQLGSGKYGLAINLGVNPDPEIPVTTIVPEPNGAPINYGGGGALGDDGHDHDVGHPSDHATDARPAQAGADAGTIATGVRQDDEHAHTGEDGPTTLVRQDGSHRPSGPNFTAADKHVWEEIGEELIEDAEAGPLGDTELSPLDRLRKFF